MYGANVILLRIKIELCLRLAYNGAQGNNVGLGIYIVFWDNDFLCIAKEMQRNI